jgi:HAD superfamily hydrolase (TIGR01549 family)
MAPIKAVLFDLDDTLWPIVPAIERAEAILYEWIAVHAPRVARRHTIESLRQRRLALLEAHPHFAIDLRALRRAGLMEAFAAESEDMALVDQAIELFSQARNAVTPFDDVLPTLSRLQGRVAIGSVSNGVADLDAIGLGGFFQASIAAHRHGVAKPHASIFHAGCTALGVKPHETLYVGDDLFIDVEGAQKAGLRAAWMKRAELKREIMPPDSICPDVVISTLYDLEKWLDHRLTLAPAAHPR